MQALYKQQGASLDISILAEEEAQDFIEEHASVLDSSFGNVEMSEPMRRRLMRSDYIFTGIKTFHELNEAFPSLVDENGERKSFERFLNDVRAIDKTYNENYLRAEYNFAQASAEMAAKWEGFMEDGDRYNLQYRTAGDDHVRPEHAALHGVTLPMSDPFWEEFYPPLGWNCRCSVVQVRKAKYAETPHDEAMTLGEEALQRDTKGIFRFNSGIESKTFADYNPYTIRRCKDCDVAKGKLSLVFVPEYQLCKGCQIIRECYQNREKANAGQLTKLTPQQKHEIYSRPMSEQFIDTVFTHASGHTVTRHLLKDIKEMDYGRVLDSAKLFAQHNDVRILPEINKEETEVRALLGLGRTKNPDLIVGIEFVDVKSPFSRANIVRNAVRASQQDAVACITDHFVDINDVEIPHFARIILSDANYTKDKVFFVVKGTLYKITIADITAG